MSLEDEVSKRVIISLYVSDEYGNDFHSRGTASNFCTRTKAKQKFEIVFKLLAHVYLRVKESF